MNPDSAYDIAIIGGGLAGLALSIQSARKGYRTLLVEKETYPFHRVCGEYISLESWNFLEELGLSLSDMQLPIINKFLLSAPNGKFLEQDLPLGGFGMSRFLLDNTLASIARKEGVHLLENTKVFDVVFKHSHSIVFTNNGETEAKVVVGAFGKRSGLDVKWKRSFIQSKPSKLNNYIGIKYHIKYPIPKDQIALHIFDNGYCGISGIEEDKSCLCYLTTAHNLTRNQQDIRKMEENVLMKNPFLNEIFSKADFLFDVPLTISQVSFEPKTQVENHMLMTGDAAGMISPLCGNGMSIALHAGKLAFQEIDLFLRNKISRYDMEVHYGQLWEKHFASRIQTGRSLQTFFGKTALANLMVGSLRKFPAISRAIIRKTHGNPF